MKLSLQVRYSLAVVCILATIVGFMGITHLYSFRILINASTLATAKSVVEALYQEEKNQKESHVEYLSRLLAEPVRKSQRKEIDALVGLEVTRPGVVYVAIRDPEGHVIAGANNGKRSRRTPGNTPPVAGRLRRGAEKFAPAQKETAHRDVGIVSRAVGSILYVTAPIMGPGRQLGTVTVGTSLQSKMTDVANFGGYLDAVASKTIRNFLVLYTGIAVMIVVIGLGIGIVMVRDMARPIRALGRYMRQIGTGNYDQPPPFERSDELGDLARELGRMAQNLKKVAQVSKLATLGELAVGVAHELNQPLNTIRLAAENVLLSRQADGKDSDFTEGKLRLISDQAAKMGDLIQRMCVVGRSEGRRSTIDARESIHDAVSVLSSQCEDQGIALEVKIPDQAVLVLGRRNELAQVVINLIANARDAVLAAGGAGDGASSPAQGRIAVRMETDPEHVMIKVADNGGGIAPDLADRVFDPFFTTKEVTKGTGLGLSISLGIVDSMGGRIYATNADGGAVFTVRLPKARGVADSVSEEELRNS